MWSRAQFLLATLPLVLCQLCCGKQQQPSSSIEQVIATYVPAAEQTELFRILYGHVPVAVELPPDVKSLAEKHKFDAKIESLVLPSDSSKQESSRGEVVRIAVLQNSITNPTTDSVQAQREGIFSRVDTLIDTAGLLGVKVLGLQEAWSMPFVFCTREKRPWMDFAESADSGPSINFVRRKARQWRMVIVSPILERDSSHMGEIWNTAVVVDHMGTVLGKHRKNHIPRVGDFNESTYYLEGNTGHPVFETAYGRVAVNICYGRHHPLNWLAFAMNGAQIVFNPSATVDGLSEPLWPIEARAAAVANSYYVAAVNRVGTETFPNEFTSGDGKAAHREFGHFYGSSYITAPDGRRTASLSRVAEGVLAADIDLSLIGQTRDNWMFQATGRYDMYAKLLTEYTSLSFKRQVVPRFGLLEESEACAASLDGENAFIKSPSN